jgi:hypothetical protein
MNRPVAAKLQQLFGIDLRTLALLRVGLGVAVLADVVMRSFDLVALYTDQGVLPRELLRAAEGRAVLLSAHYWASASPWLQGALFAFTAVCAVALMVGWRTRLLTLICWYLVASVQVRQPLGYMGGDSILRLMLFWSLFLPMAARFSVDAAKGRVRAMPDRFLSGATVAMLLQVCLIYWATGVRKNGPLWWSGQAVFYALHLDEWATPFGVYLRAYPTLHEMLTWATLGLELLGPFLAFVPVYTAAFRVATILMFWGFHLGLASAMNIGLFPLFSMVAWLAFVPTAVWERLGSPTSGAIGRPSTWPARLASVTAVVLMLYVVMLLAERARLVPRVLPTSVTQVGTVLRIQQTWNMFAPDPSRSTIRYELRTTGVDGAQVVQPATTSFRTTVYLGRVAAARDADDPLGASLVRFVRRQCLAPDVDRVALLAHAHVNHPDGPRASTTSVVVGVTCP